MMGLGDGGSFVAFFVIVVGFFQNKYLHPNSFCLQLTEL